MSLRPESEIALTEDGLEDREHLLWLIRKCQPSVDLLARVFVEYVGDDRVTDAAMAIWQQALLVRGVAASKNLSESYGPYLSPAEFAKRLGVTEETVREMTEKRQALAVTFRSCAGNFYPEFQLDANRVRPWVPKLLEALPIEPWAMLMFLSRGRDGTGGQSLLENLIEGAPSAEQVLLDDIESYLA